MKKILISIIVILVLGFAVWRFLPQFKTKTSPGPENNQNQAMNTAMTISSPAFNDNGIIPDKYTCQSDSVNPPLSFVGVPKEAKSLAIIFKDPDAPSGTWFHWLIWNIDPTTSGIAENSVPQTAIEGTTSFGKPGYGGPCPPSGTHHYIFTLYALDTKLDISSYSDHTALEGAMTGHILSQSELTGLFGK